MEKYYRKKTLEYFAQMNRINPKNEITLRNCVKACQQMADLYANLYKEGGREEEGREMEKYYRKKTLEYLEQNIRLEPNKAMSIAQRGQVHQKMGNNDLALKDYQRALALNTCPRWAQTEHDRLVKEMRQKQATGHQATGASSSRATKSHRAFRSWADEVEEELP